MKSIKRLLLLNLFLFLLTKGVFAAPKSLLSRGRQESRPLLTTEEQTDFNREQAAEEESDQRSSREY